MPNTLPIKPGVSLGRRPDRPDKRDFHLPRTLHLGVGAPLPVKCSAIAGLNLPPFDQGNLGSCTANAGVQFYRFLSQRFLDKDFIGSRLWLYYQERKLDGTTADDAGSGTREIFWTLAHKGLPPDQADPYNEAEFASATANDSVEVDELAEATPRIGAYHRINDLETLKGCLASGYAFCMGITVWQGIENPPNGVVPVPDPRVGSIGGHELFFHGYDDTVECSDGSRGAFKFRNSWGSGWALDGDGWLPYQYLNVATDWDAWTGHFGRPW